MSSSKRPEREWSFYLSDMIDFARRVSDYTSGLDQATFIADQRTYDATLRNLELIGEAARIFPSRFVLLTRKYPGGLSLPRAID